MERRREEGGVREGVRKGRVDGEREGDRAQQREGWEGGITIFFVNGYISYI